MQDWFKFQNRLYQRTQRELEDRLRQKPKSLALYEEEFVRDMKSLKDSTKARLHRALGRSDFVFWGDFHSLKQSQRTLIRFLRDEKIKPPQHIVLEVLDEELEKRVRSYAHKPTPRKAQKLIDEMQLESRFASSSDVYLDLFREAHRHGINILGMRSQKHSLKARDRDMIARLDRVSGKTWVLVGEFHAARPHLPLALQKSQPHRQILCVQQNDDRLGLKLLKALSSGRNIVFESKEKKGIPLFCILHTPLWIKWQSYLDHHLRDEDHENRIDTQEQILWCIHTLHQFFDDPRYELASLDRLMDFEVVSLEDEGLLKKLRLRAGRSRERIQAQLEASRVAFLNDQKILLLSEISLNSCAQAAAQIVLMESKKNFIPQQWDFFQCAYFEAICFLLSKVLNHSRKAKSWQDLKRKHRSELAPGESEALLAAKDFYQCFQDRHVFERKLRDFKWPAAVYLGRLLAEHAFEAFLTGELSKQRLTRLICQDFPSPLQAYEVLIELKASGRAFHQINRP